MMISNDDGSNNNNVSPARSDTVSPPVTATELSVCEYSYVAVEYACCGYTDAGDVAMLASDSPNIRTAERHYNGYLNYDYDYDNDIGFNDDVHHEEGVEFSYNDLYAGTSHTGANNHATENYVRAPSPSPGTPRSMASMFQEQEYRWRQQQEQSDRENDNSNYKALTEEAARIRRTAMSEQRTKQEERQRQHDKKVEHMRLMEEERLQLRDKAKRLLDKEKHDNDEDDQKQQELNENESYYDDDHDDISVAHSVCSQGSYSSKRDVAVKVFDVKMRQGYSLTEIKCEICDMPMMERHLDDANNTTTMECTVCPHLSPPGSPAKQQHHTYSTNQSYGTPRTITTTTNIIPYDSKADEIPNRNNTKATLLSAVQVNPPSNHEHVTVTQEQCKKHVQLMEELEFMGKMMDSNDNKEEEDETVVYLPPLLNDDATYQSEKTTTPTSTLPETTTTALHTSRNETKSNFTSNVARDNYSQQLDKNRSAVGTRRQSIDWETRRSESMNVMKDMLTRGISGDGGRGENSDKWVMVSEICQGQHCRYSPLLCRNDKKKCAVCGGTGTGSDGAYSITATNTDTSTCSVEQDSTSPSNATTTANTDQITDIMTAPITTRPLSPSLQSVKSFSSATIPDDDYTRCSQMSYFKVKHKNFASERAYAAKEIRKRMLAGWNVLDVACVKCVMPLVSNSDTKEQLCVLCGPVGNDNKNEEEQDTNSDGNSSVEEEDEEEERQRVEAEVEKMKREIIRQVKEDAERKYRKGKKEANSNANKNKAITSKSIKSEAKAKKRAAEKARLINEKNRFASIANSAKSMADGNSVSSSRYSTPCRSRINNDGDNDSIGGGCGASTTNVNDDSSIGGISIQFPPDFDYDNTDAVKHVIAMAKMKKERALSRSGNRVFDDEGSVYSEAPTLQRNHTDDDFDDGISRISMGTFFSQSVASPNREPPVSPSSSYSHNNTISTAKHSKHENENDYAVVSNDEQELNDLYLKAFGKPRTRYISPSPAVRRKSSVPSPERSIPRIRLPSPTPDKFPRLCISPSPERTRPSTKNMSLTSRGGGGGIVTSSSSSLRAISSGRANGTGGGPGAPPLGGRRTSINNERSSIVSNNNNSRGLLDDSSVGSSRRSLSYNNQHFSGLSENTKKLLNGNIATSTTNSNNDDCSSVVSNSSRRSTTSMKSQVLGSIFSQIESARSQIVSKRTSSQQDQGKVISWD